VETMSLKLQKALLIDDDCLTNYIHQIVLEESGIFEEVEIAETAMEALDKLEKEESLHQPKPEIIFVDINMPGLDGWDFIKEYNNHKTNSDKRTVIVILTSSSSQEDKIKAAYAKGVYAYVTKPLTAEKLIDVIGKYLH
jgi:CheY-like chemotaxis protein